ncbi:MAG: ribonuclease III [Patescibacteria group bacterium]
MEDLQQLQKKLNVKFDNPGLLQQAFVHRSYLNEHSFTPGHNERLEFLGDAVLELIVTEYLYAKFPDKPEGELTALRAALVRRETLKEVADELEFHKYLLLSKGEAKNAKDQAALLSNTVEAFIGALFLDQDLTVVRKFIDTYLLFKTDTILQSQAYIDDKSHLQELAQDKEGITPTYQVISENGPDHNKIFKVAVYLNGRELARGTGNSKQAAETDAAANALKTYS